jgi:putative FmdB family regulatory protein
MITYEYGCENCGHQFEKEQSIKARSLKKCPECGKRSLERLLSGGIDVFIKGDPTTVGQLASRNFDKNKSRIREHHAKTNELKPVKKEPWWSADKDTKKKIGKMNSNQINKYIMEGD